MCTTTIGRKLRQWTAAAMLLATCGAAMAQDIVIGQIAPIGVATTPEAQQLHDGTKACVDQVNRQGGVRGRKLQFFAIDDELRPPLVTEKFQQAMARKPIALVNVMGSAVLGTLLATKALDTHDVVIVGAIPGAEAFRQPGHERLFHIRSGDKAQLERVLLHSKTLGVQRIHVIYQDAGVGQSGFAVLKEGAERMGGITLSSSMSTLEPASKAEAVRRAAEAKAQAYVVLGFPHFMAEMLDQLRRAGVDQAVFALGYLSPAMAVKTAGVTGARGLGLTQAIPNANGRVLQVQREFQAAMRQFNPRLTEYSSFHLEGCVGVRVLVEGLKRIEGTPTPAALARALHQMGEIDFGGYRVRFGEGQVGSVWSDIGVMSETGRLLF
jgi:branched-chain amino acid transport system substrate-binding protein